MALGLCPGQPRENAGSGAAVSGFAAHPTHPRGFLCYAELLQRSGDQLAALTNCLAALELHPTPLNHVQAGQVLAALGHGAEAINQYRQALTSRPDLVPALNNLAWVLELLTLQIPHVKHDREVEAHLADNAGPAKPGRRAIPRRGFGRGGGLSRYGQPVRLSSRVPTTVHGRQPG